MHAPLVDPRSPTFLALLLALAVALALMAAGAGDLGTLDLSLGGEPAATAPAPDGAEAAAPVEPRATPAPEPAWLTDPLAPPFPELVSAR